MFYIGIEDLAALALIQAMKQGKRFLSYDAIEAYGNRLKLPTSQFSPNPQKQ